MMQTMNGSMTATTMNYYLTVVIEARIQLDEISLQTTSKPRMWLDESFTFLSKDP